MIASRYFGNDGLLLGVALLLMQDQIPTSGATGCRRAPARALSSMSVTSRLLHEAVCLPSIWVVPSADACAKLLESVAKLLPLDEWASPAKNRIPVGTQQAARRPSDAVRQIELVCDLRATAFGAGSR